MNRKKLGEFGFIRILKEKIPQPDKRKGLRGIGDDCAIFPQSDNRCELVTTDMLVERVHFLRDKIPPKLLGRKSLAVNLSDIAAMGGSPSHFFLALGIPESISDNFLDEMIDGLAELSREEKVVLAGGDTTLSQDDLIVTITVIGHSEKGKILKRSGACPGDIIQISSDTGLSAAGLYLLLNGIDSRQFPSLLHSHFNPKPLIDLGLLLSHSGFVTAAIDTSDGLLQDLGHICEESGTGATINVNTLSIHPEIKELATLTNIDPMFWVLSGGEDYQLCWTVTPDYAEQLLKTVIQAGFLNARSIGAIDKEHGVRALSDGLDYLIGEKGWDHFS